MAWIEPLKMLNVYLISPGALNEKARSVMPNYMNDLDVLAGSVNAYGTRQAIAKKLGGLVPEDDGMDEIIDILSTCASDAESGLYSPGFVQFMREIYPPKRNIAGWLANYIIKSELGGFRGPLEERVKIAEKFMVKYGIHDRGSRTVTVPARPTKKFLRTGLRKILMGMHYSKLIERYKNIARQESAEEPSEQAEMEHVCIHT